MKDMGLVREAAGERGFATPLADAAYWAYENGSSLGLGGEDDSGVVRVFEEEPERTEILRRAGGLSSVRNCKTPEIRFCALPIARGV